VSELNRVVVEVCYEGDAWHVFRAGEFVTDPAGTRAWVPGVDAAEAAEFVAYMHARPRLLSRSRFRVVPLGADAAALRPRQCSGPRPP
jgi:hypothetical protein